MSILSILVFSFKAIVRIAMCILMLQMDHAKFFRKTMNIVWTRQKQGIALKRRAYTLIVAKQELKVILKNISENIYMERIFNDEVHFWSYVHCYIKIQYHMSTLETDVHVVFPVAGFISLAFVEVPSLNVNRNVIKTMNVKAMLHWVMENLTENVYLLPLQDAQANVLSKIMELLDHYL